MTAQVNEQDNIIKWLLGDDVGISSKTIVAYLTNNKTEYMCHPLDPSDFNRCIKCLDAIPSLKLRFGEMANLSHSWKTLVDNWEEIKTLFISEAGYDWSKAKSAPKTYDFMQQLFSKEIK